MAIRRRLIILLCLFTALVIASPVSAATSTRLNDVEDFVDATSNLYLATPDIGTHSVFADLQDYGANYDQMQEANTGSAGNNVEDFVDQISDLHAPSPDVGTHAGGGFAEMQDKDGVFDLLTEADTGGGGGVNEYRFVDTCPALALWSSTGTTPYLDAVDASNIYGSGSIAWSVWIEFAETSGSGTGFTVNMSTYLDNDDGDETVNWELDWTNDGVADATNSWVPSTTPAWMSTGTISGLDTQIEIDACRIRFDNVKGAGGPGKTTIDASRLGISQAGGTVYDLDLEVGWTTADYDETSGEELCIFGGTQGSEALRVDVWSGSWTNVITDLAAGWNNVSVASYLTDQTFEIRFLDTTGDAVEADTWQVEGVLLHCWTTGSSNYELDLEIGWTTVDYDETVEELCIYPVTGGSWPAEDIKVDIWTGSWTNLFADLTPDQWNNITIASYLTDATVEVRFLGGTETGDTNQDTWEIDAVLIHTYSYAYTENRYETISIDEIISTAADFVRDFSESITIDDSITTLVTIVKALFEALAVAVSLTASASLKKIFSESITLSPSFSEVGTFVRALYESITFADSISTQQMVQKILFESITLSPSFSEVGTFARTLFESITLSPTFNEAGTFARILFENITFANTISTQQMIQKILFEAVVVTVTISTASSFSRKLAESIVISPTFSDIGTFAREYFEGVTFADSVDATKIAGGNNYEKTLFESFTLSDSESLVSSFVRVLSESIIISDTTTTTFIGLWVKNLFESILFGENDIWADYRVTDTTTTFNPDKRRVIIPPIFPPNLVLAGIGVGAIFWIYFYGVPHVEDSKATAYTRREKFKYELRKVLSPILGRPYRNRPRRKLEPIHRRIKRAIIEPLERLWRTIWKADR